MAMKGIRNQAPCQGPCQGAQVSMKGIRTEFTKDGSIEQANVILRRD